MSHTFRGNITVFTALSLMLTASFLFALLEAARIRMLYAYADRKTELGLESVCAEYQPGLWKEYGLLCLDGAYGGKEFSADYVTGTLKVRMDENLSVKDKGNSDLFAIRLEEIEPKGYELLTDREGIVFLQRIAAYMEANIAMDTIEGLYNRYLEGVEVEKSATQEDCVAGAQTALEQAEKEAAEKEAAEKDGNSPGETDNEPRQPGTGENSGGANVSGQENPLDVALALRQNALLGMVTDTGNISGLRINLSDSLLHRKCRTGTYSGEQKSEWYERVLVLNYLDRYFSDVRKPADKHVLAYETEYLLCGEDSDRKNLEGTVIRLMILREAANILHIISDHAKMNQAGTIAASLAGFTGNPAIIKIVQTGIIASWAYIESIQDVRALLQGDKIALIKSVKEWTTDTGNLSESFRNTSKARNCEKGLTYQEYLRQFMFSMGKKKLAYRMMDIMERNIRLTENGANCRMDHMIGRIDYEMTYGAEFLFSEMTTIGKKPEGPFLLKARKQFSY